MITATIIFSIVASCFCIGYLIGYELAMQKHDRRGG